jgi:DNA-binding CsgD family transcriptional regulator
MTVTDSLVSRQRHIDVRILVLGPFHAARSGVTVAFTERERTMLCALLAAEGRYREVDDRVSAESLRSKLGAAIVVAGVGLYACAFDRVRVDSRDFEQAVKAGQARLDADDPAEAEHAFTTALGLWRGPPFAELSTREAVALRARFHELRDQAATGLAEARLQAGRAAHALADLEALVVEEPLHERRWWLLMLALYRCGRRAEALATFGRARRELIDTAGIEPGPDLHALENRIRLDDASLDRSSDGVRATAHGSVLSRRESEVAWLAARGLTNLQIAQQLGTSPRTIGNQLQAVYNKLGTHSRKELVGECMRYGPELVSAPSARRA